MKRFGLYIAIAIVMITNVIILSGVAYNRSGNPEFSIDLTERELPLKHISKENSGLFLSLNWNMQGKTINGSNSPKNNWLNKSKLEQLGFNTSFPLDTKRSWEQYYSQLPKEAFIVLEYEGDAWEKWETKLKNEIRTLKEKLGKETIKKSINFQKRRIRNLEWDLYYKSRLYAIDAGINLFSLKEKYPNQSNYLIVPGTIKIQKYNLSEFNSEGKKINKPYLSGYIKELSIMDIYVPSDQKDILKNLPPRVPKYSNEKMDGIEIKPRYKVQLNLGKRLEPWIQNITRLN